MLHRNYFIDTWKPENALAPGSISNKSNSEGSGSFSCESNFLKSSDSVGKSDCSVDDKSLISNDSTWSFQLRNFSGREHSPISGYHSMTLAPSQSFVTHSLDQSSVDIQDVCEGENSTIKRSSISEISSMDFEFLAIDDSILGDEDLKQSFFDAESGIGNSTQQHVRDPLDNANKLLMVCESNSTSSYAEQATKITKLEEDVKEMQDTIKFLTKVIRELTEFIHESLVETIEILDD